MQRIILILFTITAISFASLLGYLNHANETKLYPLPYKITEGTYPTDNIAETADILIIGDQFGIEFNSLVQNMIENLSVNLQNPLSVYNLSVENEGIHRTLKKISQMKKLPPIIIYAGGSSEFAEELYPKDLKKFKVNFNIFKNDYIQTAVMLFPILSRFVYIPDKVIQLDQKIKAATKRDDRSFQVIAESTFYFYREQFMDLIDHIIDKGSTPIVITRPINYELDVKAVCDNAVTDNITIEQVEISKLIEKNKIKEAYNKALLLDGISVGNARTKYLLGMTQIAQGKLNMAKKNLLLAKALDCRPEGAHPVINQIQRDIIRERALENVDFDKMVNNNLGKNELFIDNHSPQFIYWEKLEKEMTNKIRRILDL
ncbi:hypothetical protein [Bacteriovorax sp. DB6_IX]|uniref:hypothetical protein n=1 Tax=Bacteriovorax sp. DB6_IX TaxID=1353530 RepID=UPI00038A1BFB|nr:hypothetical protein [Bacteriovorax sp. DB6_IX]EQC44123.1 hypothetical protein M901_0830 [Bacteriovorax sp. DB6_IX]